MPNPTTIFTGVDDALLPQTRTFACNLCDACCGLRVTVDGDRVLAIRGDPDDFFSRGHV
jgi:anaerobic selenocysteine-containing dehydrogenase